MSESAVRPPRLALALLRLSRSSPLTESAVGDLIEEFEQHIVPERGRFAARVWFWKQAINVLIVRPGREVGRIDRTGTKQHSPRSESMSAFLRDVRQATRGLWRTPGFTVVAVATLALGIGSNTAVYTVVRGVLLSPLPYSEPDRLVKLGGFIPGIGTSELAGSPAELVDYRERARAFDGITSVWPLHANLVGGDAPVRIATALVAPNFFEVLGVNPLLGRTFRRDEMHLGIGTTAVLSWAAWQRYFGGADDIVGRTINIDGDPVEVVGVMARSFHHPGEPLGADIEMWGTMDLEPGGRWFFRNFRPMTLFARLAPGATVENARAELQGITGDLRAEYPQSYPEGSGWMTGVEPLRTEVVGEMEQVLLIVFGAVVFVLLVAFANVSALLLTRGAVRARLTAVRLALGGGRRDIIRFQLAESLVLSVVGGLISVAVAFGTTGALRTIAAQYLPRAELIQFDPSVLLFALSVSMVAGMIFGLAPAVIASLTDPLAYLADGARGSSLSGGRLRDGMVVGEVAVSVVLVVASGLLLRSFTSLMSVEMGFDPTDIQVVQTYLPVQVDPNEGVYRSMPNRIGFYSEVLRRLEEEPDVVAAAGISHLPLRENNGVPFQVEGREQDVNSPPNAEYRVISPTYFDVMSIPLREGRSFSTFDNVDVDLVAIVNEAWVEAHAQDRSPLGMRLRIGTNPSAPLREIVGVVGDVRTQSLDIGARETIYAPYLQVAGHNMTFVIDTPSPSGSILDRARAIVQQVDPDQPAFAMAPMEQVVAESVAERRVLVWMVSLFGILALSLAGLGVFGVTSFRVRQRSREMGIRMALGAAPRSIAGLVVRDGLRLGSAGAVVGLLGAVVATRALDSMLFGVGRLDVLVLGAVAFSAMAVAVIGVLIPARQAAAADPIDVLRMEG